MTCAIDMGRSFESGSMDEKKVTQFSSKGEQIGDIRVP